MSILVVNSLKNSTGSSPTLTWPTTDGTDGQVLQSSNNAGNLIFGGSQLEAQNGTNITFPASAADDSTFVTDANGALTATVAGSNPMNTPDNAHQGERLLDKYVISGSAGNVSQITLIVPTGYTNTDLNTIRSMRVACRGMQTGTGGTYRPTIQLLEQDGSDFFSGTGQNPSSTYVRFGVDGKDRDVGNIMQSTSSQNMYITRHNVYRTSLGASNEDYFSSTTLNANQALNGSSCWNANIYINPSSSPSIISKIDYNFDSSIPSNYRNTQVYLMNFCGQLASGNDKGRHPMGIKINNNASNSWVSGVIELYGTFKDGVVS